MHYQTHWRLAFLLAFFFHLVAWLFLMVFIPHVFQMLEPPQQQKPMEWVDIADDTGMPEEVQEEEAVPPPPPTEPIEVEEESAVVEAEIPEEAIAEILKAADEMAAQPEEQRVLRSGPGKRMGEPGKILYSEQPPYGVFSYKGRVMVFAKVGPDGRVIDARTSVSSGIKLVDFRAEAIVKTRWKFKPATDSNGEPMSSDILCEVAFNVPPKKASTVK